MAAVVLVMMMVMMMVMVMVMVMVMPTSATMEVGTATKLTSAVSP